MNSTRLSYFQQIFKQCADESTFYNFKEIFQSLAVIYTNICIYKGLSINLKRSGISNQTIL